MRSSSATDTEAFIAELARTARQMETDAAEVYGEARGLRESITELQRWTRDGNQEWNPTQVVPIRSEPEAEVSLTRGELLALTRGEDEMPTVESERNIRSARDKLFQALAIEQGPGGRFGDRIA